METKDKILIAGIVVVLFAILFYRYANITGNSVKVGEHDDLAKHLTARGFKMYGTEWCSHCKDQKKLFGSSFRYVDYIDCDKNKQACISAGVKGYPTWSVNGQNLPGVQSIEKLSELSGYGENI